ncbi:MAG: glycosyltransferase family 39 protein [Methanobrevibacter sp.]
MKSDLMRSLRRNQDKISLSFVIVFFAIVTLLLIYINSNTNFLGRSYRDVYLYLSLALRFSGVQFTGYAYINNLPPLVPFLTSLLFRLGFVNVSSIFIVCGIFYFIGNVFFYKLLRIRFRNPYALVGAIIYGCLSINLLWAANGTIDIPSVSLSIIALYALIMAVDNNQKYFYLAFPVLVLAFLAKYTALLMVPVMFLYYIFKVFSWRKLKSYWKNTLGGIVLGIITSLPYVGYVLINHYAFGFLSQSGEVAGEVAKQSQLSHPVVNDLGFYLTHVVDCISNLSILSYIVLFVFLLGLFLVLYRTRNILKITYNQQYIRLFGRDIPLSIIYKLIIICILALIAVFLTAGRFTVVLSELLLFGIIYFMGVLSNKVIGKYNHIPRKRKYKYFNFDILMFTWFFSYLVFFTSHITKADRYFTTIAPGFMALVILAFYVIMNTNKIRNISFDLKQNHRKDYNIKLSTIILLIFGLVFIISAAYSLNVDKHDSLVDDEQNMANYLSSNYPDYVNTVVSANRAPIYLWYLHKEIKPISISNNSTILDYDLKKYNTTYYIGNDSSLDVTNYNKIINYGDVTLYKKSEGLN